MARARNESKLKGNRPNKVKSKPKVQVESICVRGRFYGIRHLAPEGFMGDVICVKFHCFSQLWGGGGVAARLVKRAAGAAQAAARRTCEFQPFLSFVASFK